MGGSVFHFGFEVSVRHAALWSPTCACTVCSGQPAASMVAARSVPPPPVRKTIAEDDRERRRRPVPRGCRAGGAAGHRAGPDDVERRCGRLRRFGGFGSAIFPGHRRAIVPIRRVLTAEVSRRPTPSLAFVGPMVILALILGLVLGALVVGCRVAPPGRCRTPARRHARRARRRTPLVRREGRRRRAGGVRRRVPGEQLGVPRDRRVEADRVRQAAEGVAREGRRPGADAGAGARAGVRRAR